MNSLKHYFRRNRPRTGLVSKLLLTWLFLVTVLTSVAQAQSDPFGTVPAPFATPPPAGPANPAVTQDDDPDQPGSAPTDVDRKNLSKALGQIQNVRDAQIAFFNEAFDDNESKELSVDQQKGLGLGDGYQPVTGSQIAKKFYGNPYFTLDSTSGDTANCLHDPDNNDCIKDEAGNDIPLSKVRFVLTQVVYGHEPDVESIKITGDSGDYNAYVFRNEFNPSIAIELTARDNAGNEKHLVYYKPCDNGIIEDENQVSQIDWGGDLSDEDRFDPILTSEDDRDIVDETADAYGGLKVCDVNNSFFADVMQWVMTAMKDMMDAVFEWVKDALLDVFDVGTLSDNTGLVNAWKTIRDFVNLIFILLLSIVAFSNILRIDTERYGIRSLLPRLVLAVVAVNFSFLLVQLMTNAAFIISQPFVDTAFDLLRNPPADASIIDPTNGIGSFMVALLLVFAVLIGFIILFVFFVVRILVIWILAALSPFVFLLMVLPLSRSLAASWWKNAFKWIFMGPIAFILLYVAAEMLSAPTKNEDVNGPDFLLKVAFFVGAAIAAVMIPLKLGGEVMRAATGGIRKTGRAGFGAGRGLGGAVARQTGMAAAWEQQKSKRDRERQLKGAGIRQKVGGAASRATGGRIGSDTKTEAEAQLAGHQQEEAQMYAGRFNDSELESLQKALPPGSELHDTLQMARDMRTGVYQEGQRADQEGVRGFTALPKALQDKRLRTFTNRNVKEKDPELLQHLAEQGPDPETGERQFNNISSDAVRGILDHNDSKQIHALRTAHANGNVSDQQLAGLGRDHMATFNHRIRDGKDTPVPGRGQRPDVDPEDESPRLGRQSGQESDGVDRSGSGPGGIFIAGTDKPKPDEPGGRPNDSGRPQ